MPVAGERGYFAGILRLELRSELGQFRVRQARVPVMHAMIWLMEQRESDEPAERALLTQCFGWSCSPWNR